MWFKNQNKTLPPRPSFLQIALAWVFSAMAIATIALLDQYVDQPLMLASFGASCVLLFGFPDAVFSRPRNVIAGHFLGALIGLLFLKWLGDEWWSMALAVSTALAVMLATRTAHPPAGANTIIVFLVKPDWQFLVLPTLCGVLVLLVISRLYRSLIRRIIAR